MTYLLHTGTRPIQALATDARVAHAPLLRVRLHELRHTALPALLDAQPCALVIASQHAVRALARADLLARAAHAPTLWAVGARTARALRALAPELTVVEAPEDDQTFAGLSAMMRQAPQLDRTVIYLGLEDAPRDLARAMRGLGVTTHQLSAYSTEADPEALLNIIETRGLPAWIMLTSPRGAGALAAALDASDAAKREALGRVRRAVIGPSAAAELDALGWPADLISPAPDAGLLAQKLLALPWHQGYTGEV